jgi:hypothetical protein
VQTIALQNATTFIFQFATGPTGNITGWQITLLGRA